MTNWPQVLQLIDYDANTIVRDPETNEILLSDWLQYCR
jgi:uncharacterized lipoprotein